MGRNGASKKQKTAVSWPPPRAPMTLREEATGRKEGNVNARTMNRIDHLKGLALWAATEASIPSLGAFFGQRLAASTEAVGVRSDPNLFFCERCESVLQPGQNCTVRIEKNKQSMRRRKKKSSNATQNNVVYGCHFCSHRNSMRGTSKGYIQEISPPKTKQPSRLDAAYNVVQRSTSLTQATPTAVRANNKMDAVAFPITDRPSLEPSSPSTPLPATGLSLLDAKRRERTKQNTKKTTEPEGSSIAADPTAVRANNKMDAIAFPDTDRPSLEPSTPLSPLPTTGLSLLDSKRRKRTRQSSKKTAEPEGNSITADAEKSGCTSSKRRRKSWTSLKEIAQSAEQDTVKKLTNLTIPLFR